MSLAITQVSKHDIQRIMQMQIKQVKVESLIPYARNSRTHSDAQVAQIAASIKEFGWTNPILVDGTNGIIAGHGRLLAARKLGYTEVPVIELENMTESQKKAYVIADNQLAMNAGWDTSMLTLELGDLKEAGFSLDILGFDPKELDNLLEPEQVDGLTDEDAVPDIPEEPVTKLGDIYQLGNHRLMCGDSTSIDAVDKLMDGQKADMVFTDPPYGIGLDKEGQKLGKSQAYGAVLNDHDNTVAIDVFNLVKTLCDGSIFFWGANHYSHALPSSPCWIVWDKQGGKRVTFADVELCYSNIEAPARLITHIWDGFRRDSEKGDKRVHPTQKPVQLITEIWDLFSKHISGLFVLDLFGGSGSTLIACEKTNRHARIMELDPKYCDVIVKRWEEFTGKQAVLLTND
jgi:16S rRNA G966 N2-methylase RsmD